MVGSRKGFGLPRGQVVEEDSGAAGAGAVRRERFLAFGAESVGAGQARRGQRLRAGRAVLGLAAADGVVAWALADGGAGGCAWVVTTLCSKACKSGGHMDTVVVHRVDRLSRSLLDFAKMM